MDYSNITELEIQKRLYSLPERTRRILTSKDTSETVKIIAAEHLLNEEEELALEQLVALIILEFTPIEQMLQEIEKNVYLKDKQTAFKLAELLNIRIFSQIPGFEKPQSLSKNQITPAVAPPNIYPLKPQQQTNLESSSDVKKN